MKLFLKFRKMIGKVIWALRRSRGYGLFNSVYPVSETFGLDRGTPIDRYFINQFMRQVSELEINYANALEVGSFEYIELFTVGSRECITLDKETKKAVLLDLCDSIPSRYIGRYDLIIATQVLQFVSDPSRFFVNLNSMLSDDGVIYLSGTFISPISKYDQDRWGEFVRLNPFILEKMIAPYGLDLKSLQWWGNKFLCQLFLEGLAYEDIKNLSAQSYRDSRYPLVWCAEISKLH